MSDSLIGVFKVFGRRKIAFQEGTDARMTRSLFIIDITCLGLSTTLGTGIFTLLAHAAKHETGPSVVLSFLIAAVASCLGGLCYSELSSRFPEGGPSYVYLYATLGEIWAFLVAWSMIFEYVIASSLAAKSLTSYLDNVTNGSLVNLFHIQTQSLQFLPGFEDHYLDLLSALIIVSIGALLSLDLKLSCLINNIAVFICSLVIAGIVMVALSDMDPENWTAGPGFFPNGVNGIFSAASLCFFAFHGYDIISSIAGETQHRIRIVPVGISLAFLLGLVACFSSSVAITLLIPYSLMDDNAPIIQTFTLRGYDAMKYLVILGATSGLCASIIATLLGLSRLLFTMSSDGLLPSSLSKYDSNKGTTSIATICALLLSSSVALTVQSSTLFLWLGFGSLLSYMFVSIAILSLRYGLPDQLPIEASELVQSDSSFDSISQSTPELTSPASYQPDLTCQVCLKAHQSQPENYICTPAQAGQPLTSTNFEAFNSFVNNNYSPPTVTRNVKPLRLKALQGSFTNSNCLLPHSFSDCLLTQRTFNCDTNKCKLCMGRPCLKPNRTFIKGANMYGTMDKPKPMTVDFLHNSKFISSIPKLESGLQLDVYSDSLDKLPTEKSSTKVSRK
uniref:Cationic amino acid transporter C-terminal domain-containing protein n=1 Tax=Tetranychus urticae TaxID=32264 RepID=T1K1T9_TETUR